MENLSELQKAIVKEETNPAINKDYISKMLQIMPSLMGIKSELVLGPQKLSLGYSSDGDIYYFSKQISLGLNTDANKAIADKLLNSTAIMFAMNGSFIMTPLGRVNDSTKAALSLGSLAYDNDGNSMVGRVRFRVSLITVMQVDMLDIEIKFDEAYAKACYEHELVVPDFYIFAIK